MSDLAATFLGFARDAEASALVLDKYLERIHIQTETNHGKMGQYEDMDWEHGEVWWAIQDSVELPQ